jgi:hypothetical protein
MPKQLGNSSKKKTNECYNEITKLTGESKEILLRNS